MRSIAFQHHRLLYAIIRTDDSWTMCFHTDGVNAGIGTEPAGHLHQRVVDVTFLVIQHLRAGFFACDLQAIWKSINADDALGSEQVGTLHGELSDRAATPNSNRIAGLDVAVLGGHIACWKNIRQEQDLFVAQAVGNFYRSHIGKGHASVFRLSAGEAAEHVSIAVNSRGRMAEKLLRHPSVGVGILTQRKKLSLAEKTFAARNGEGCDHPIAG